MTHRDELKRKFIACINMNAHDGVDTITLDQESVECMAEACLSAIEQSGCTIQYPNKPTFTSTWDELSSSPFTEEKDNG